MGRRGSATAGAVLLCLLVLASLGAPWLSPGRPDQTDLAAILQPPGAGHPLGTDDLGRDVWSRLLHGGRVSLAIGAGVAGVALGLGSLAGALGGYYGGWLDGALMRLADLFLAFPGVVVLLAVAAVMPVTPPVAVLVMGAFSWMVIARLVRGSLLSLRAAPFVLFARSLGVGGGRVVFRHLLPHAAGPVLVAAVLGMANAVLVESAISYLGLGIQPPTPTWGNLLNQGQSYVTSAPWLVLAPGLALFITLLSLHLLADGLRERLDPRLQQALTPRPERRGRWEEGGRR